MPGLADFLRDVLGMSPMHGHETANHGTIYSSGLDTDPEMYKSIAAVKNKNAADQQISDFHDRSGPRSLWGDNYPTYDPNVPRDFSPESYGTHERGNALRNLDSLNMDVDAGPFNYIKNEDAKQVLLGIAESQYKNRNQDINRGSMGRNPSGHHEGDIEVIIRKKAPKSPIQKEAYGDAQSGYTEPDVTKGDKLSNPFNRQPEGTMNIIRPKGRDKGIKVGADDKFRTTPRGPY